MARDSSPSGSSSGSSSASASRSPSPPPVSAIASSSRSKPQSTSTHEYQPPTGYVASDLSSSSLQHGAIDGQGKQVWLFKLPEGVNAADLDGMKLDVKKGKKVKANGVRVGQDKYRLVEASSSSSQDARNAQAGLSDKRAKREGEKSQLVDDDDEGADGANASNVAQGAYLYLPTSSSGRAGQVRNSKVPISRRFELLLDVNAPQAQPVEKKKKPEDGPVGEPLTPAEARLAIIEKHRQMKGYFAPVGSLYDAGEDGNGDSASATTKAEAPRSHPLVIYEKPKDKKRKKADADAEAENTTAAGVGATSPSPRKEKKAKKEDGGSASSKEAKKASEKAASKERKKERKDKKGRA